ncbi:hypothetical protein ABVK25_003201 [Lepraria finkii]|uniref:Secreted protein n=1 Tax=Lepraria finkii TaxID=1340010 RepID=A0ABR4BJ13_9LECA
MASMTTTTAAIATAAAASTTSQATPGTNSKAVTAMPGMDMGGFTDCKSSVRNLLHPSSLLLQSTNPLALDVLELVHP